VIAIQNSGMITVLPIFIKIIKNINYTVTYEIIIRYNSSKNVICHHCGDLILLNLTKV
jgi:hypothetical protein